MKMETPISKLSDEELFQELQKIREERRTRIENIRKMTREKSDKSELKAQKKIRDLETELLLQQILESRKKKEEGKTEEGKTE